MPRAVSAATSSRAAMPLSTVTISDGAHSPTTRSSAAADRPYPSSKRCGMNGWTQPPSARSASVSRQVDVMPSTSKSPNTAMDSPTARADATRSATSTRPGIMDGSSQSRSSEGVRNRRPSSGSVIPRATMMRATSAGTPRASARRRSAAASLFATTQRCVVLSEGTADHPQRESCTGWDAERGEKAARIGIALHRRQLSGWARCGGPSC